MVTYKKIIKIYSSILVLILFVFLPGIVGAASLFVDPSDGVYEVGDHIVLKIKVSSDVPINAISSDIIFPTSNVMVESLSKSGSIIDFWVNEPTFSKGSGLVHLEGVSLSGFKGSAGTVLSVGLKVINTGQINVLFKSGQILANDGQGTDLTNNLSGGNFTLNEAKVKPVVQKAVVDTKKEQTTLVEENNLEKSKLLIESKQVLKEPYIYYGNKYGNPAILGTSDYPSSKVLLTFISQEGNKLFIVGNTDSSGEFVLTVPSSLKSNKYKVTAVIIKEDKSESKFSNEIIIQVGSIFGDLDFKVKVAFVLLICSLLYLIFRIYTHFKFDKNIHYFIKKESHQAEDVVDKSFSVLKKEVDLYLKHKDIRNKDEVVEIKKDLDEAEEIIKKEIDDIKSL
jgi:hypothetical protein